MLEDWDDCLVEIDYSGEQATCLAHGERLCAVGPADGTISLYYSESMHAKSSLVHDERVNILTFGVED